MTHIKAIKSMGLPKYRCVRFCKKSDLEVLSLGKFVYRVLSVLIGLCVLTLCACAPKPLTAEAETTTVKKMVYEAERAQMSGGVKMRTNIKGYSGEGYATAFEKDDSKCLFTVEIPQDGFYDLNFISASGPNEYKENYVDVDGERIGIVSVNSATFTDSVCERVYMAKGTHTVAFIKYWGWTHLDRLQITLSNPISSDAYNIAPALVNKSADDNAKRLMKYLTDIYGTKFLSGQYCDTGANGKENFAIRTVTGKRPAVLGLDLMEATPSRVLNGSKDAAVDYAIEFDKMGGIVTFCWHWNAPEDYITDIWWRAFYTDATNIDLKRIMDGDDSKGYDLIIRDIDAIAEELKKLENAGVPVLWRPLHEASGGWFWWGAKGPEAYIQLWNLVYDRLTNVHGLNNLIWVWNGQDKAWYPGDATVDIIGEDIYPGEKVYASQMGRYLQALDYTDANKMIVLSENGVLFDPDLAIRDGAMWGFFATWGGEFVLKSDKLSVYSEQFTETAMLKKVYAHESVLTLEDLPDLKNYPVD